MVSTVTDLVRVELVNSVGASRAARSNGSKSVAVRRVVSRYGVARDVSVMLRAGGDR